MSDGQPVAYRAALATPAAAGLAVICAATALGGVVSGLSWLAYVIVVVLVIGATGLALRSFRAPAPLVALGQLVVLACLVVTLFTRTGFLVILPGPAALHDLGTVLAQAMDDVRTGVPPVNADAAILCLSMIAIGLVAVVVDTLAVTAQAPAACGLILLCVYAVPASLADDMLPWLSFALGAGAFAVLLAVNGSHRHQVWRGHSATPTDQSGATAPAAFGVTAAAVAIALVIGSQFTAIGTIGRLPGAADGLGGGSTYLGINAFTELRGVLNSRGSAELFEVRGLPANAPYLRALTLSNYDPGKGWDLGGGMAPGVRADGQLPDATGESGGGSTRDVQIQPVRWSDVWLPVYGIPRQLSGVSDAYHYDNRSGTVFSQTARRPDNYTEKAVLAEPTRTQLRETGEDFTEVQNYLRLSKVDPKISALARQIVAGEATEFDRAKALTDYFTNPVNGFRYSTKTDNNDSADALVDFLFNGKTGFCEQYASSMAVLARAVGIPARVAIGFTPGYVDGDHRTITSQDAHAWVEIYFPGYGWETFDPTPLQDGRAYQPSYLSANSDDGDDDIPTASKGAGSSASGVVPSAGATTTTTAGGANAASGTSGGSHDGEYWTLGVLVVLSAALTTLWAVLRRRPPPLEDRSDGLLDNRWLRRLTGPLALCGWLLVLVFAVGLLSPWLAALVLVLALAALPAAVRETRRRRNLHAVSTLGPDAAGAAWHELLAESADRGAALVGSDTVRTAARRMAREHALDEEGRDGLRTMIDAVEVSWYGGHRAADPNLPQAFDGVRRSLRRNAPLAMRARLLPKSVLQSGKPRQDSD